jgi:hypothetical protein
VTAKDMADPIEETAGALKSAQEAMPKLPAVPPQAVPGSAPRGADEASLVTEGSPLGAAVGATAAGSESAFQAQSEQEDLKRVAVETMQRFEAAALGIDQATPHFQEQGTKLRPRADDDGEPPPDDGQWARQVDAATGVDARWPLLTGMTDASAAGRSFESGGGGFGGFSDGAAAIGGGGGLGVVPGPVAGRGTLGDISERAGGRGGLPASGVVPAGSSPGMTGPAGAPPMGGMGTGAQAGEQSHRRRVPYDADNPFDTGEKASKPVIGL